MGFSSEMLDKKYDFRFLVGDNIRDMRKKFNIALFQQKQMELAKREGGNRRLTVPQLPSSIDHSKSLLSQSRKRMKVISV